MSPIYVLLDFVFHLLPVDRNKVLFSGWGGKYHDNPKYLSQKLHEMMPEKEIYWEMWDFSCKEDIPDYVRILIPNTFKHCIYKNRCRVVVDSGAGYSSFNTTNKFKHSLQKLLLYNKKQYNLSTWHGNPVKCFGADIHGNEDWSVESYFTSSKGMLTDSDYVAKIMKGAYLNKMPMINIGTPRTDLLFDKTFRLKELLKNKLGLPLDKKIIMYAPTWRDNADDSGLIQLAMIDVDQLTRALHDKFGGDWVFLLRTHNNVLNALRERGIFEKYGSKIINGNKGIDMMEYMCATDILLTDFSGSVYDVALTKNPCFLFSHDLEKYEKERGMYKPISFFPYTFSDSFEDLLNDISKFDEDEAEKKRLSFLKAIGNKNDGKSSQRVVEFLKDKF